MNKIYKSVWNKKTDNSTVTLSGANTYSGGTKIEGGTLALTNGNAAGTGVRVAKSFVAPGCLVVRPEAYLGVSYDVIFEDEHSSVRLANGSFYNVTAEELNRFAVEAGLGISAEITYNLEANLNYLGNYRKDFTSHAAMFGFKYKF